MTVVTRCQILRLKCPKFDFGWGSAPDPAGGAYSDSPDPLGGFKGPTSKGREGMGGGRDERKREGRGWEREGREKGRGTCPKVLGGIDAPEHHHQLCIVRELENSITAVDRMQVSGSDYV